MICTTEHRWTAGRFLSRPRLFLPSKRTFRFWRHPTYCWMGTRDFL